MEEEEPPIREFADRGTLWLLRSPNNLKELVRLLSAEIADRLDFARAQRSNRSFIPEDLHKQEADLLFRVPFREGRRWLWIYVLLEHQSKPDRTMGLRLLSYMIQIWNSQVRDWQDKKTPPSERKLHPVLPIVFYTGKRNWKYPISLSTMMDMPELLNRFVPKWETLFLNLHTTPSSELAQSETAVAAVLRALQASEASHEQLAQVLAEVAKQLDRLPEEAQASWQRAMLYLYLLIRHTREPEEQDSLFDVLDEAMEQHREEMKEVKMTGAQVLQAQGRREGRKEGKEEGLQEGRQEGRIVGRFEILLKQLHYKFGPLSEEAEAKVKALTEQEIDTMTQRILTATTLAEMGL